jgi:hypothetical protein
LSVPTFLHEQNSVPGRVNRLASRFTREALVTFPAAGEYLGRARWVGMPTRVEMFGLRGRNTLRELGLEPPVVLIFGGSGGALRINLAAGRRRSGQDAPTRWYRSPGGGFSGRRVDGQPAHRILEYVGTTYGATWRHRAWSSAAPARGRCSTSRRPVGRRFSSPSRTLRATTSSTTPATSPGERQPS